ncbi:MAG: glycosyltransferase family 4 protein, partial [Pirellulales bacterium]
MKIVHIITRMIVGGAQENTLYNCTDLINDHGDDITLITGPSLGPEGELLTGNTHPKLNMSVAPSLRRNIHPWHDWQAYRQIKRLLRELQPDIVHTHSAKAGLLGRWAAHRLRIKGIVHTVHGAPFHPYQNLVPRNLFRYCEKLAARRCHKLISVCDAMTNQLVAAKVAPLEKFTTIYSGMEISDFINADSHRSSVRQEFGFDDDDIVVGKIARLFDLKGHEYLVTAASEIVKTNPAVHFLLVGDGILREKIEMQIERAGLSEHFHFAGLVPPSQIPRYLGAMDILAHTSLREGLARALPQALLAGRPVVSFDIDGAKEVCISEETGYLIEPRDVAGLETAILKLAESKALRDALGNRGQQICAAMYPHQIMT